MPQACFCGFIHPDELRRHIPQPSMRESLAAWRVAVVLCDSCRRICTSGVPGVMRRISAKYYQLIQYVLKSLADATGSRVRWRCLVMLDGRNRNSAGTGRRGWYRPVGAKALRAMGGVAAVFAARRSRLSRCDAYRWRLGERCSARRQDRCLAAVGKRERLQPRGALKEFGADCRRSLVSRCPCRLSDQMVSPFSRLMRRKKADQSASRDIALPAPAAS